MVELARIVYYLGVHLLYASLVWLCAWVLTSFSFGSSTTKYWIWVATALNFVIPTGAILDRIWSNHLAWATPLAFIGAAGVAAIEHTAVAGILGLVWLGGAALMLLRLVRRLRSERSDTSGQSLEAWTRHGVPVKVTSDRCSPAVSGLLRPHISLPPGIDRLLSESELDAVLLHELTHAKRRDNLVRLVYELGLCVFWFHPLVWLSGTRLALYRELSCDESVIAHDRGIDLISALSKLASPRGDFLLQASASSFVSHRLARLAARHRAERGASALLAMLFSAVIAGGVLETIAHTACCFLRR